MSIFQTEKFRNIWKSKILSYGLQGFFKEHNYEVGEAITFDETKLQEKLNTFACMQEENMIPPKDAYIAFENNSFVIKPEEAGTTLDKALLTEKLLASVKESKIPFLPKKQAFMCFRQLPIKMRR